MINIVLILGLHLDSVGGNSHLRSFYAEILLHLSIYHLIFAIIAFIIRIVERYPVVTYYKNISKTALLINHTNFFKNLQMYITDFETIYYFGYIILSCLGLWYYVIYIFLLLDIIK